MPVVVRVPPGRAGRMWLERRTATAQRGRDQLDRKLRLLVPEQQRQRIRASLCQREWAEACAGARTWFLRASVLGGQDAIRHATPPASARVELTWATEMGLRYPSGAALLPPAGAHLAVADNAAVAPAVAVAVAALAAAVRSAAAEEAVRRIDSEVALTRRRLRALDKVWLPALQRAMAALDLSLDQAEQEDGTRLRRASPGPGSRGRS